MKKVLYAVMLLLGLSVLFVSCNKDNGGGNYSNAIIGTWKLVYDGDDFATFTYEFKKDGTFTYITHINEEDALLGGQDIKSGPFYYKINGDKLEIGALGYVIIQEITATKMVWAYPDSEVFATLTRVK